MEIKIDKNVPVPANSKKRSSEWRELAFSMAPGDSVYFASMKDGANALVAQFRHAGIKAKIRAYGSGYRVWRI